MSRRPPPKASYAGIIAESWREALPPVRVERVVRFVRQVWEDTAGKNYEKFHHGANEPHLTRVLCTRLQKLKINAGLTGQFVREAPIDRMDEETGEFDVSGRADIQYSSDREGHEIVVIFEFKKLRNNSGHRSGYIDDGMARFVKGIYASDHPLGFMVGITAKIDADKALKGLRRSMLNPTKRTMLSMVADDAGEFLRAPETELVGLVDFETLHTRTVIEAPDIFLGHFFLDLVTRGATAAHGDDLPEPD